MACRPGCLGSHRHGWPDCHSGLAGGSPSKERGHNPGDHRLRGGWPWSPGRVGPRRFCRGARNSSGFRNIMSLRGGGRVCRCKRSPAYMVQPLRLVRGRNSTSDTHCAVATTVTRAREAAAGTWRCRCPGDDCLSIVQQVTGSAADRACGADGRPGGPFHSANNGCPRQATDS